MRRPRPLRPAQGRARRRSRRAQLRPGRVSAGSQLVGEEPKALRVGPEHGELAPQVGEGRARDARPERVHHAKEFLRPRPGGSHLGHALVLLAQKDGQGALRTQGALKAGVGRGISRAVELLLPLVSGRLSVILSTVAQDVPGLQEDAAGTRPRGRRSDLRAAARQEVLKDPGPARQQTRHHQARQGSARRRRTRRVPAPPPRAGSLQGALPVHNPRNG